MRSIFSISLMLLVMAMPGLAAAKAGNLPADKPAEKQISAEPLGEGESIPFMRTEQNAPTEEPSSGGLLLKTLGSMIFIIGLIFLGAWGARKLGFGNLGIGNSETGAQLSVLTSVSLGNGRTVSAIQFGSRTLLVGSTPQSFTLLAEEANENSAVQSAPRSVAELLADEKISFDTELDRAALRMATIGQGGQIN